MSHFEAEMYQNPGCEIAVWCTEGSRMVQFSDGKINLQGQTMVPPSPWEYAKVRECKSCEYKSLKVLEYDL